MDLSKMMHISAAGMKVQGERMRIISENLANSSSTAATADGLPYRRKVISFRNQLDRELGVPLVRVARYGVDSSEFGKKFDPGHPNAGPDGFLMLPNVKPLIEMVDMREAQRSYEANLNMIKIAKDMMRRTIDLLAP